MIEFTIKLTPVKGTSDADGTRRLRRLLRYALRSCGLRCIEVKRSDEEEGKQEAVGAA